MCQLIYVKSLFNVRQDLFPSSIKNRNNNDMF